VNIRATSDQSIHGRPGLVNVFSTGNNNAITDIRTYAAIQTDNQPRVLARDTQNKLWLDNAVNVATLAGNNSLGVSMVPFRPPASPQAWMYVACETDYQKISAPMAGNNTVIAQKVGIAEPQVPLEAGPVAPSFYNFSGNNSNWAAGGTAQAPVINGTRVSDTAGNSIADPVIPTRYSVQVGASDAYQAEEIVSIGGTQVIVQDVVPPVAPLTIQGIYYYAGATGRCIIVPSQLPVGQEPPGLPQLGFLRRGALVELNSSEIVLVRNVTEGPNGALSFETSTVSTHASGETITGIPAIVVDGAHTGSIAGTLVEFLQEAGIGYITQSLGTNPFTQIPLQVDDYIHVSLLVGDPTQIVEIQIQFNVDSADTTFTQNIYYYSISPSVLAGVLTGGTTQNEALLATGQNILSLSQVTSIQQQIFSLQTSLQEAEAVPQVVNPNAVTQLQAAITALQNQLSSAALSASGSTSAGYAQWTEVMFPISALTRLGNDQTRTLANCTGVRIWVNSSGAGTAAWQPSTSYALGQLILDPAGHTQKVTTAGVSGATIPTFNDSGGTTSDGSVTWTDQGAGVSASTSISAGSLWVGGGSQPDIGDAGANYQYLAAPYSSLTGATGNPTPVMRYGVGPRRQAVTLKLPSAAYDPQIDTWAIYRYGGSITSYRFIGSTPSTSTTFTDNFFDDTAKAGNPVVETNFEPWPSIGLPFKSTGSIVATGTFIQVTDSSITWPSNILNWLPGTLIQIGGQNTFTLYARPTKISSTSYLFQIEESAGYIASAGSFWVNEPIIARQFLPYMDGPDAYGTLFAVGDQLRPGGVSWAQQNMPDSAPDTNYLELCDPSQPLMRPFVLQGVTLIASTARWWSLYPSFTQQGAYTQYEQPVGRAPITPWGCCTDKQNVYFWEKTGISRTSGGPAESLTDADLLNLFPHEGAQGQGVQGVDIVRNGVTWYAPDYSRAAQFRLKIVNKYLFAMYLDTTGAYRTLVCDLHGVPAWSQDIYGKGAISITDVWAPEQQSGSLLTSGTLYPAMYLADNAGNVYKEQNYTNDTNIPIDCVVGTFETDGGDLRAQQQFGDAYVDSLPANGLTVTPTSLNAPAAPAVTISGSTARTFSPVSVGGALTVKFFGLQFNWEDDYYHGQTIATHLYLWQPSLVPQPEIITNRIGEWTNCGQNGAKFFQGARIHLSTFNKSKNIQIRDSDTNALHAFQEMPVTAPGETIIACSFITPFVAHEVRDESQDSNPWLNWGLEYIWQPTPETVRVWITQASAMGLKGYMTVPRVEAAWSSTEPVTLTITSFDGVSPRVITLPATGGAYQKLLVTLTANKGQTYQWSATSPATFQLFLDDWIAWVGAWGRGGGMVPFQNLGGQFGNKAAI
jgi:hypothetical protein